MKNTINHLKHCRLVCMVYTTLGESLVTNIALDFTLCYISHSTLILCCIYIPYKLMAVLNNTRRLCFGDITSRIPFLSSLLSPLMKSSSPQVSKMMCISSQLCSVLVTIDVKAIAKPWNVLTGGSSFFKGTFLTKAMKSIQWHGFNL